METYVHTHTHIHTHTYLVIFGIRLPFPFLLGKIEVGRDHIDHADKEGIVLLQPLEEGFILDSHDLLSVCVCVCVCVCMWVGVVMICM